MATISEGQATSELNRELTRLLSAAGERFGFDVVCEYPVRGGRLDVVWTWTPPTSIPGLDTGVPVVGFEVESSWRTRKHVKGDLLNLQDAGVALGVIVLAGDGEKDDSLRRFAELLVDRPGAQVLVWTAEDVRALADEVSFAVPADASALSAVKDRTGSPPDAASAASSLASASHAGKYSPLHRWLRAQERTTISVTFAEVEEVLGFPLPNSCRNHVPHWHSYEGSAVARAIIDAGWKASRVNLRDQTVTLMRFDGR
jgi:hypothetical protein